MIPMVEYIALNNPNEAVMLLRECNIQDPRSQADLIAKLKFIVSTEREEGILKLINIHPDKWLFDNLSEKQMEQAMATIVEKKEVKSNSCGCESNFSNCSGCGGTCGSKKMSNADGATTTTTATPEPKVIMMEKTDYVPMLLASAVVLVALKLLL